MSCIEKEIKVHVTTKDCMSVHTTILNIEDGKFNSDVYKAGFVSTPAHECEDKKCPNNDDNHC
jgi:hypothetical protein